MLKKRNFAILGLGTFGTTICEVLAGKGASVIAMDRDTAALERVKGIVTAAIMVDTTNEDSLLKAPLADIDVAIVAIGDNLEASILTTTLLKQRGVPYVAARAVSAIHATVLRRVGANEVLNVEEEMGMRIARRLVAPDVLDSVPFSDEISLSEVLVPEFFVGKTSQALNLEETMKVRVTAVARMDVDLDDSGNTTKIERILFSDSELKFEAGDRLFIIGRNADLEEFRAL